MNKETALWRVAFDAWRAQRDGVEAIALRREKRLAELIAYVRSRSPFYRRLYAGLPEGPVTLESLPPVNKPQLMAAFDEWITDPALGRTGVDDILADAAVTGVAYRDRLFVCTSSGTTGRPGIFVHDRAAVDVYRALNTIRLSLAWLGWRDWGLLVRRGIRWAAVMAASGPFIGAGWLELERRRSAWKSRAYRVFPVERPLGELIRDISAFDPTILSGYPSAPDLLAEAQLAGHLHLRLVLVESAGESITEAARFRIEAAFGVPVHVAYGASEFLSLGVSCPQGWIHVNSDWAILEPVDRNFRPTLCGEASYTVLLTNLANWIQPIIRYDLGDSVIVRPDPCPCGSPLQAIRIAGRCDDILHLVATDGHSVAVLPLAIGSVMEEVPGVHHGQLLQTGPSTLRLRLVPAEGADVERLWCEVVGALRSFLNGQGLGQVDIAAPKKRRSKAGEVASSARSSRRPGPDGERHYARLVVDGW
jgi:phenylacetate-coenzyme A ligase PaaK-like adenylate-forming protein